MKVNLVMTYQMYYNIIMKDQRYMVYENKLCYVNDVILLDTYKDVLMGVPDEIDCVLVEMYLTVNFEFGVKDNVETL